LPFTCTNPQKFLQDIKEVRFTVPEFISKDASDLIKSLLVFAPEKRLSAKQVSKHIWLNKREKMDRPQFFKFQIPIKEKMAVWRGVKDDSGKLKLLASILSEDINTVCVSQKDDGDTEVKGIRCMQPATELSFSCTIQMHENGKQKQFVFSFKNGSSRDFLGMVPKIKATIDRRERKLKKEQRAQKRKKKAKISSQFRPLSELQMDGKKIAKKSSRARKKKHHDFSSSDDSSSSSSSSESGFWSFLKRARKKSRSSSTFRASASDGSATFNKNDFNTSSPRRERKSRAPKKAKKSLPYEGEPTESPGKGKREKKKDDSGKRKRRTKSVSATSEESSDNEIELLDISFRSSHSGVLKRPKAKKKGVYVKAKKFTTTDTKYHTWSRDALIKKILELEQRVFELEFDPRNSDSIKSKRKKKPKTSPQFRSLQQLRLEVKEEGKKKRKPKRSSSKKERRESSSSTTRG